jgi:HK97 family phage major capsid protein
MPIGDLIEERATLVTEQRGILDKAEGETRELTSEESQEFDRIDSRVGDVTAEIRRHEKNQEHSELDIRAIPVERQETEDNGSEERTVSRDTDEYRDALTAYARGGSANLSAEQRSTLNVGVDAEGGFAVPDVWGTLHESLREAGTVRQLATVVTTESGNPFHVPFVSADAEAPKKVKEAEEYPDDAEEMGEKVIQAYKYGRMTKASEEVVQDALFDVAGFVGFRLGFDIGRVVNGRYVAGTGSEQPEGLFKGATTGVTGISKTAGPTGDNLIDLQHSIIRPYRGNASFIMSDGTLAIVRKLKDKNEQYLWQPSLQVGEPDRILGNPVYSDPDVETIGAEKLIAGFGDVKRAYLIRDVLGVTIRFLPERFADKGQVAWRGTLRTGGAIVDQNAFKTAKCAA